MKDLIIVGAGGFGREVVDIIEQINDVTPTWNIVGFVDDTMEKQGSKQNRYPVIGTIHNWAVKKKQNFVIAIAKPSVKMTIVEYLESKGASFVTIKHPQSRVSKSAKIGRGCVLYANSSIGPDTHIGNFITLLSSPIGHDAIIGDYTTISTNCDITGGCRLGERVFLASSVSLRPEIEIGDDAYIGMGSVVVRNVKRDSRVFGNPAKLMDF